MVHKHLKNKGILSKIKDKEHALFIIGTKNLVKGLIPEWKTLNPLVFQSGWTETKLLCVHIYLHFISAIVILPYFRVSPGYWQSL